MNELALFAGAGGGILGGLLLGWRTVCAVEIDAYCRDVLLARQRDGYLPRFPIWDDVRTFDGHPWRGHVDVISGGFPCQDISSAGKRAGIEGERSGLWSEFARVIREVEPGNVLVENSSDLVFRGLGTVLGDLAAMGFDARWGVLGADDCGAPHRRDRVWIVATHPDRGRERIQPQHAKMARPPRYPSAHGNANGEGQSASDIGFRATEPGGISRISENGGGPRSAGHRREHAKSGQRVGSSMWWNVHRFEGMDDGMAHRVERVRATGNGQVPAVVRLAWDLLAG